jgi:signal peptidase I
MNIDLAFWLLLLVIITGAVYIYDRLVLAPKRRQVLAGLAEDADERQREESTRVNFWVDLAVSLFPIFLLVLLLRSFLVEPFRIPSSSMMPTLLIGDFILVNKYTYGLRLPVLNSKVFDLGAPQRGDVVVFRFPEDPRIPFIKRVVGLPGDEIVYHNFNKTLYVNGELVPNEYVAVYQGVGQGSDMTGADEFIEYLGETPHHILVRERAYHVDVIRLTVPENEYFVLGDNRDNSGDSRFWGTVPEANLIGKAFLIWMNGSLKSGLNIDWKRIGIKIQ